MNEIAVETGHISDAQEALSKEAGGPCRTGKKA